MTRATDLRLSARALRGYATRRENAGDACDAQAIRDLANDQIREAEKLETEAKQ